MSAELKEDIPIAVINSNWTDEQRRIVWCLICKARRGLQVELSPIIASAFIILQRYFRQSDKCSYELFILMVAALFTACKAADCYRPIEIVYAEITRICQSAPCMKIRSLLGEREGQEGNAVINAEDFVAITHAELELLRSIDFNLEIDTPFTHFERWKKTLVAMIPNEELMRLCNSVIVDICLMICSGAYLDVPPEVAAAAATEESVNMAVVPRETFEWVMSVKEKYGQQLFDLAVESISEEKRKTAFRGPPPNHPGRGSNPQGQPM